MIMQNAALKSRSNVWHYRPSKLIDFNGAFLEEHLDGEVHVHLGYSIQV